MSITEVYAGPSGSDTIPARTDPLSYLSVYRFASAFTAPLTVSVLFWTLIHGGGETHNVNYDILPNTTFLLIVAVVCDPASLLLPEKRVAIQWTFSLVLHPESQYGWRSQERKWKVWRGAAARVL
ncbi:MAG: hypothetical protein FE78DRAFT_29950 [Acidomyces sp. 'richmondensis']|nr:MAG: hypothetical protein FE78DRAFT_29950 [Acidomyces sp. 'richmondensis']